MTGASGFLGGALVRELSSAGAKVVGTFKSSTPTHSASLCSVSWVHWSATESEVPPVDWSDLFAVVHMAANTRGLSPTADRESYATIVASTRALLRASRRHGVARFLFVSSGDVLAAGERGVACEDDWTYAPQTFYGACKVAAEMLVRLSAPPMAASVVRVFHPYGEGGDAFLVNRLVRMVQAGEPITLHGDEGFLLNPVTAEDVAVGMRLALEVGGQGVFHLAGRELVSLRALAERIGIVVGRAPVVRPAKGRSETCHAGCFERSTRELGFFPSVGLDTGLRRLAQAM